MQVLSDLYAVLGIPPGASNEEVKKAWRACALRWHPDKNPDDKEAEERFKACSNAYHTLGDPERRRAYDDYVWPPDDARTWRVDPTNIWETLERDAIILYREARKQRAARRRPWHSASSSFDVEGYYRERARGPEGEEARRAWRRSQRRHHRPGMIWPQIERRISCSQS